MPFSSLLHCSRSVCIILKKYGWSSQTTASEWRIFKEKSSFWNTTDATWNRLKFSTASTKILTLNCSFFLFFSLTTKARNKQKKPAAFSRTKVSYNTLWKINMSHCWISLHHGRTRWWKKELLRQLFKTENLIYPQVNVIYLPACLIHLGPGDIWYLEHLKEIWHFIY